AQFAERDPIVASLSEAHPWSPSHRSEPFGEPSRERRTLPFGPPSRKRLALLRIWRERSDRSRVAPRGLVLGDSPTRAATREKRHPCSLRPPARTPQPPRPLAPHENAPPR